MESAKDYLYKYLGGNMFVETLTPKAISEFAEDYNRLYKKEIIAIIDKMIDNLDEKYIMIRLAKKNILYELREKLNGT